MLFRRERGLRRLRKLRPAAAGVSRCRGDRPHTVCRSRMRQRTHQKILCCEQFENNDFRLHQRGQEKRKVIKQLELKMWKIQKISTLALALLVAFAMAYPTRSMAQETAGIHGHVNNPIGQPITKGDVKLTTDRTADASSRKYAYTFPIDASGNYKGSGVTPGNYVVIVFVDNKSIDFNDNVALAANDDKQVDFDMSRKEYIDKMTPDERKQLEEFK